MPQVISAGRSDPAPRELCESCRTDGAPWLPGAAEARAPGLQPARGQIQALLAGGEKAAPGCPEPRGEMRPGMAKKDLALFE